MNINAVIPGEEQEANLLCPTSNQGAHWVKYVGALLSSAVFPKLGSAAPGGPLAECRGPRSFSRISGTRLLFKKQKSGLIEFIF